MAPPMTKVYTVAPMTGQKKSSLKILGLYDEYIALTAKDCPGRTIEDSSRLRYIDFLCLAHSLPSEIKDDVLEYHLPNLDPLDITDIANHARPSWCASNRAEFTHWRHRRLIFRTDDLTNGNLDSKLTTAQTFVQNILFSTTHAASFPTQHYPKKKIVFEMLLRINFSGGHSPAIADANLTALWRLLHLLNGEMGHLHLVFVWKNDTNPLDISAATKKEIASDDTGLLVAIKQNLLSILLTACSLYSSCLNAPPTLPAAQKWQRYLSPAVANDVSITDDRRWGIVREWTTMQVTTQVGRMWTTRNKKGFVVWNLCVLFHVKWPRNDADVRAYGWWLGEPQFPLDLGALA